jgi:hypothetical protein
MLLHGRAVHCARMRRNRQRPLRGPCCKNSAFPVPVFPGGGVEDLCECCGSCQLQNKAQVMPQAGVRTSSALIPRCMRRRSTVKVLRVSLCGRYRRSAESIDQARHGRFRGSRADEVLRGQKFQRTEKERVSSCPRKVSLHTMRIFQAGVSYEEPLRGEGTPFTSTG